MNWNTHERRNFVRANVPCKITIRNSQNQPSIGKTENISAGGIRFIIEQKLSMDSIIDLEISEIKNSPIRCKVQIKWIFSRTPPKDALCSHLFDVGAEFYEISSDDLSSIKKFLGSTLTNKSNQKDQTI